MASEATVVSSLQLTKGNLVYQSQPTSFQADVSGTGGPTPGMLSVPTTGVNVDLSQLSRPGLCRIANISTSGYLEYGIHDGSIFHPLGEVLAGESYILRLSRNIGQEEDVPGTGSTGVVNALFLRGVGATVKAIVEAFEV